MHRQDIARLDDVVAIEELTGTGVAADMHQRIATVYDGRAQAGEPVDHPKDSVFVAGDQ